MKGDSGQLPVDFLVGFTIFILCLIMAANFVPSLLVGLQRTTGIDYDAVAYRTAVVLVEDQGETYLAQLPEFPIGGIPSAYDIDYVWQPWEMRADKDQVSRFGLALTRDTPNILSINKISRFFGCTTFPYSETAPGKGPLNDGDYRKKLLFSSYQYGYNVTLRNISPMKPGEPVLDLSIGEPYPAGYGYIRRYVVIKQNSDGAAIDFTRRLEFNATTDGQVKQNFSIRLDGSVLYNRSIDTPFKLDLQRMPLVLNISGFRYVLNNSMPGNNTSPIACRENTTPPGPPEGVIPCEWNGTAPMTANLTAVTFVDNLFDRTDTIQRCGVEMCVNLTIDGIDRAFPLTGKVAVNNTINLSVNYIDAGMLNYQPPSENDLVITFVFQDDIPHTLVTGEYLVDYNRTNMTQPFLSTGMLEVGIW